MVESQLISDPNPNIPRPLELEKYLPFYDQLKTKRCKSCNQRFSTLSQIFHYQHSSGWIVPGYEKKQWLYIKCANCGEEISLWKLGVGKNLLPDEHNNENLQNIWKEKSHPGALEHNSLLFQEKEKLEKEIELMKLLCLEKIGLQSEIANLKLEKAQYETMQIIGSPSSWEICHLFKKYTNLIIQAKEKNYTKEGYEEVIEKNLISLVSKLPNGSYTFPSFQITRNNSDTFGEGY